VPLPLGQAHMSRHLAPRDERWDDGRQPSRTVVATKSGEVSDIGSPDSDSLLSRSERATMRKPWESNPQTSRARHLFSRQAPHQFG
jgi:hypothetical protein